jgi:NAD(P)-dependent dehydrogenase (short-subunit alcohol dehydrogenase family)
MANALTGIADTAMDLLVLPGYSRIGYQVRRSWWPADPAPDALRGTVAVVTGARGGLGLAAARGLAGLGAKVRIVVRDRAKVEPTTAEVDECDLSSLADVRRYASLLAEQEPAVHVLVHNAGTLPARRTETKEGHELTLATHVLGPLLLTQLLRPTLAEGAARVIFVSSGGMYTQGLAADDPEYTTGTYRGATAYARTKRMQVVLAGMLAPRLAADGVTVHACHPGWADTPGLATSLPGFQKWLRPLLRTADQGADTITWLAAADRPGRTSGLFWHDRAPRPTHLLPWTRDTERQRDRWWRFCQDATRPAHRV